MTRNRGRFGRLLFDTGAFVKFSFDGPCTRLCASRPWVLGIILATGSPEPEVVYRMAQTTCNTPRKVLSGPVEAPATNLRSVLLLGL